MAAEQLTLNFSATPVVTHGPGGTLIVRPGKVVVTPPDISVPEAAKRLNIPERTVLDLIHRSLRGELDPPIKAWRPCNKPGGRWRISVASLEAIRAANSTVRG